VLLCDAPMRTDPCLLLLLALIAQNARAQSGFVETLGAAGYDEALGCAATPGQTTVVCGSTHVLNSAGFSDAYVLQLDSSGAITWQLVLGEGDHDERFSKVIRTASGDLVAIGQAGGLPASWPQVMVARITAEGDLLWCKRYPVTTYGEGYAVLERDGGHLLCSTAMIQGLSVFLRLLELDADGMPVWSTYYDTPSDTQGGVALFRTPDGNSLMVGIVNVSPGINAGFALKVDDVGTVLWYRRYFSTQEDTRLNAGYASSTAQADGLVFVGSFEDGDTLAPDLLLVGTDASGVVGWARTVDDAEALDVVPQASPASGAIVAGRMLGADTAMVAFGIDDEGNVGWSKAAITPGEGVANAICIQQPNGPITLAGMLLPPGPVNEASFIARMANDGGPDPCVPLVPRFSVPTVVTDSSAAITPHALTSQVFDCGFTPVTGLGLASTFCQSTGIPTPGFPGTTQLALRLDEHEDLVLTWPTADPATVVRIFDAIGRLEMVVRFNTTPVDISGLAPGLHLVLVGDGALSSRSTFFKR
jgi:hypothetical protein